MKNNRITKAMFVVSFLLVGSVSTALSSSTYFVPLGDDDPFTYNDIPFEQWGIQLEVYKTDFGFVPTQSIDLSGYTTEKIHIIEAAAWADNVPDGVVVGHINVHYADGSSETFDLVVGVNIAEWAYDWPVVDPYLQHTKVPPAYSYWTDIGSPGEYYWGHNFYVQITTQEKPLDNLELILNPASYTGQQYYGMGPADWFGITINAITLQVSAESPEGMLAGLALFIMDEVDSGNIAPELEGSLLVKINAALAALDRGNPNDAKVAMNDLKALINQVEAQTNKKITPEAAAEIIQRINAIITNLAG